MKPFVAADIGNSSIKLGRYDELPRESLAQPAELFQYATEEPVPAALERWLPAETCQWRISSVHRDGRWRLVYWLARHRPGDVFHVLEQADLPIRVEVDHPERVGLDRLAAAVAVNALREPGRGAILVGAGSAITVNWIDAQGAFQGGAILPGFKMSAEALFGAADLLPLALLEPLAEPPAALAKNTDAAIRSGLFWGAVGAVRELVAQFSQGQSPPPQVFITGGDLRRFEEHLGPEAQFVPHLVLCGIAWAARGLR